jgi:hypothetical protein
MSAYNRGEITIEAYLVRILAALCRQAGGELRVKGELIDTVGEATALLKSWDTAKQELVLTVSLGTFGEVFRVVPEKQTAGQVVIRPAMEPEPMKPANGTAARSTSTIDDDAKLIELESKLRKRRIAAMLQDEMRRNRPQPGG